jgi:hypothetical protein
MQGLCQEDGNGESGVGNSVALRFLPFPISEPPFLPAQKKTPAVAGRGWGTAKRRETNPSVTTGNFQGERSGGA